MWCFKVGLLPAAARWATGATNTNWCGRIATATEVCTVSHTPLLQALHELVSAMKPTHLVLNSGLWGSSNQFGVSA